MPASNMTAPDLAALREALNAAERVSQGVALRIDADELNRLNQEFTAAYDRAALAANPEPAREPDLAALHDGLVALYGECRHNPLLGSASDCDVLRAALAATPTAPDRARVGGTAMSRELREAAIDDLERYVKTSRSHPTTFRAGLLSRIAALRASNLQMFTGQMTWPCTCGHPKSDHYFGDALDSEGRMHTSCQRRDGCHRFVSPTTETPK